MAFAWRLRLHARLVGATIDVDIHPTVRLRGRQHVFLRRGTRTRLEIGPGSTLDRNVLLYLAGGQLYLGERVRVRSGCVLRVNGGRLQVVGDNILSYNLVIHCDERVVFGPESFTGEGVTIGDSEHVRPDDPRTQFQHSITTAPVEIGARTWLAAKVTVTSGVRVGDDVTVAANAVVATDVPDGSVVGGVPARPLFPRVD